MVHEHVDNVLEQVGLFGGEETTAQLLNDLPKLRNSVVVLLGTVPENGRPSVSTLERGF